MGKPAARVGDFHLCPMVTGLVPHIGGPLLPPGARSVLVDGQPAATQGGAAFCAGLTDVVVRGSPTVLFGGKPAARQGDPTAHGGLIAAGSAKLLIGDAPRYEVLGSLLVGARPAVPPVPWDRENSLAYLRAHALAGYSKHCAKWVREALEAGGIPWTKDPRKRPVAGKDFGPELERNRFAVIATGKTTSRKPPTEGGYQPQAGDVIVFDSVPGHPYGHVVMCDGKAWISDALQGASPVASEAYVAHHGLYTIYRRP